MSEEELNEAIQYNLDYLEGKISIEEELEEANKEIERLDAELKLYKDNQEHLNNLLEERDNIIKEVREKVDNFDVFKEFTFPLMKRDEEQQVKSSINYEWRKSVKEPILEILDKVEENK